MLRSLAPSAFRTRVMPSSSLAAGALHQQLRAINIGRSVQTKMQKQHSEEAKMSDYDFDRERWSRQTKWHTMDCIIDPDVSTINYTSFGGLRKYFKRWLAMRTLMERRPNFKVDQLKELFIQYKTVANASDKASLRLLPRLTTYGEAKRLEEIAAKRFNEQFAATSWKNLKMAKTVSHYVIDITDIEIVTCFIGQMTKEDWLQISCKVTYRECFVDREAEMQKKMAIFEKKKAEGLLAPDEKPPTDADLWQSTVEYPVFEVKMGDGIQVLNNSPFIVVAVMDETGARYGKDGNDASQLRKAFGATKKGSWFGAGT